MKSKTIRLSPMIPSRDLEVTKQFLVNRLEFKVIIDSPGYIVVSRGDYDLHLCSAGDNIGEISLYLEVDDLESIWAHFSKTPVEGIRVREPFEQAYGMREFHLDLPETKALLFVGQKSG